MTNLTGVASYDAVYQLETNDPALAGNSAEQRMNRQAQALLNRFTYLQSVNGGSKIGLPAAGPLAAGTLEQQMNALAGGLASGFQRQNINGITEGQTIVLCGNGGSIFGEYELLLASPNREVRITFSVAAQPFGYPYLSIITQNNYSSIANFVNFRFLNPTGSPGWVLLVSVINLQAATTAGVTLLGWGQLPIVALSTTVPAGTISTGTKYGIMALENTIGLGKYPTQLGSESIPDLQLLGRVGTTGVVFPVVQVPRTDPNTLDDYEVGLWTPNLRTGVGSGSVNYVYRFGQYIKLGDLVTLSATIQWNAGTYPDLNSILVDNLPFAVSDTPYSVGSALVSGGPVFTGSPSALAQNSTPSFISFPCSVSNNAGSFNVSFKPTGVLVFTISYRVQ